MSSQPKTIEVAVYPNGREVPIIRSTNGWAWNYNCWSSHKDSAIDQATNAGATIERRPNPRHRAEKLPTYHKLMRGIFR